MVLMVEADMDVVVVVELGDVTQLLLLGTNMLTTNPPQLVILISTSEKE